MNTGTGENFSVKLRAAVLLIKTVLRRFSELLFLPVLVFTSAYFAL